MGTGKLSDGQAVQPRLSSKEDMRAARVGLGWNMLCWGQSGSFSLTVLVGYFLIVISHIDSKYFTTTSMSHICHPCTQQSELNYLQ